MPAQTPHSKVNAEALAQIWLDARTHHGWENKPVDESLLRELYDLMKWAPTSANASPARIVFIMSKEEKERLLPLVLPGNQEQTRAAPVTAIIGYALNFWTQMKKLYPDNPEFETMFSSMPDLAQETAFRNSSLQGGYFILAARALGLDCGPMSGFDAPAINKAFFPDGDIKANFLCNLGYGKKSSLYPRGARLDFGEACRII